MKALIDSLLLAACLACFACTGATQPGEDPRPTWDTSLVIHGSVVSSDSVARRALVESGNGARTAAFLKKCRAGGVVRLGFIGGSITQGASASSDSTRYSRLLGRHLARAFPRTEFREINAGIGATNSRFGCSRAQRDLLDSLPDLVVVEFAVNDDAADGESRAHFEGLLRRIIPATRGPVIVFQTMNDAGDSANHSVQISVARHYGLPVVSYRAGLWPWVAHSRVPWSALGADYVHPNDTGHAACAYLLYAYFRRASLEGKDPAGLPAPLVSARYQDADFLRDGGGAVEAASVLGWTEQGDPGRRGFVSDTAGSVLALEVNAQELTLMYHRSKDKASRVAVELDGVGVDTLESRFEQDWGGGFLAHRRVLLQPGSATRSVRLIHLGGGRFDLRHILHAGAG